MPLVVTGSGTYTCGQGFHGCVAWLAIRSLDWTMPASWVPGRDDRIFDSAAGPGGLTRWTVSGPGRGGPDRLPPGTYRFLALYSESDDTKPWAPGTDDEPGTGVLNLVVNCEAAVTVPADADSLAVAMTFGPGCAIDATPSGTPGPGRSAAPPVPTREPVDASSVATLCDETWRVSEPIDLSCLDAAALAIASVPWVDGIRLADVRWDPICGSSCPRPRADAVQVVVVGRSEIAAVMVTLSPRGDLIVGRIAPLDPPAGGLYATALPPAPIARASIPDAPTEIGERTALPLCGEETSGMAGPFDYQARECFVVAVLTGGAAEFLSRTGSMEGDPVLELYRYDRSGPVTVYSWEGPPYGSGWVRGACALEIVGDGGAENDPMFRPACFESQPVR